MEQYQAPKQSEESRKGCGPTRDVSVEAYRVILIENSMGPTLFRALSNQSAVRICEAGGDQNG